MTRTLDATDLAAIRRRVGKLKADRIGYVTQASSVYSDLTAAQNVRYFASLYGRPASAAAETPCSCASCPAACRPASTG